MKSYFRILVMAGLILAVFFSLPVWLPSAMAAFSTPQATAMPAAAMELAAAQSAVVQSAAASEPNPRLAEAAPMLLWSNNWSQAESNEALLVAWQPADGSSLWQLNTGFAYGALADAASGRLYYMHGPVAGEAGEPAAIRLNAVDLASGELLSSTALTERYFANTSNGATRPVLLLGDLLYFTNYGSSLNLAAYDLRTNTLGEERYDLCETGYPTQWGYSAARNALVTMCIDFSTGMAGSVSQLSLADGSLRSIKLPQLGSEEYMSGNGIAVAGERAYAVDSDARQIVEIDLETMTILRQAGYASGEAARQPLWQQAAAWLLEQAASPAAAKRMFAVTALSPDGGQLAVGGSYFEKDAHSVYLIDLATLETTQQLQVKANPYNLAYANPDALVVFFEANSPITGRGVSVDLSTGRQYEIALPSLGYLSQLINLN